MKQSIASITYHWIEVHPRDIEDMELFGWKLIGIDYDEDKALMYAVINS